jgi:phage host-nuclease inhibitor protein Gam
MVAASPAAPKLPLLKPPTSREAADELLLEMGRLNALQARNKADFEKELATLKQKYSARNTVDVDGKPMAIADRMIQFEVALAEYAEANKAELIDEKKRSVKLNFGAIGWRKQPDGLEAVDGQSNAGRASLLDRLHEYGIEQMATFPDLSQPALACLNVQITWRRDALLHAAQDKRVDAVELRRIGFKVVEGEDNLQLKPAPVDLSSQPATSA